MAQQHAIAGTHCQIGRGEQLQVGRINGFRCIAIGFVHARSKELVLVDVPFADALILPLGQLVVAQQIVNTCRDTGI